MRPLKTRMDVRLAAVLLAACAVFASTADAAPADTYLDHVNAVRAKRLASLTRPDGWLSLVGLHFLQPGTSTIGTAADNQIVLAAGPAHFGTVKLAPDGSVTYTPTPGLNAMIDGKPAHAAELQLENGDAPPTLVSWDSASFFVIDRGGRRALRVKDSASPRRLRFPGLAYFPVDPSWRIEARWVPFEAPRHIPITNILGNVSSEQVTGRAVFERGGKTYELTPILEGPDDPLFFIVADATSGESTYEMRFLYADPPRDGKLVLDFNLAVNPPCAFTPFATCPLPPKGNRLELAITAGEKRFAGSEK